MNICEENNILILKVLFFPYVGDPPGYHYFVALSNSVVVAENQVLRISKHHTLPPLLGLLLPTIFLAKYSEAYGIYSFFSR